MVAHQAGCDAAGTCLIDCSECSQANLSDRITEQEPDEDFFNSLLDAEYDEAEEQAALDYWAAEERNASEVHDREEAEAKAWYEVQHKQWEAQMMVWDAAHPNACHKCGGRGFLYSTYDPSPPGISLGSGSMTDCDVCSCVESGQCPRCSSALVDLSADNLDITCRCSNCGWTDSEANDYDQGRPDEPEWWG